MDEKAEKILKAIKSKKHLKQLSVKVNGSIVDDMKQRAEVEEMTLSEFTRLIIHLGFSDYLKNISNNLVLDEDDYA